MAEEWWSPQDAALSTGFDEETLRKWGRGNSPHVRRQEAYVGKKRLVQLHAGDVLREAAKGTPRRRITPSPAGSGATRPDVSDRVAVLEDVARLHRAIEEHRATIESLYREIEVVLSGPSVVPNDG